MYTYIYQNVRFVLFISFGGRGEYKKFDFCFKKTFPKSSDSFSLYIIMDEHCSPGFYDSVNSR